MLRPAIMSGVLSDMLTASLAKHSRTLRETQYFNGHPDLIVQGVYLVTDHRHFEPELQQVEHRPIRHPLRHRREQFRVRYHHAQDRFHPIRLRPQRLTQFRQEFGYPLASLGVLE